jgi:hypothetical protein
MINLLIFTIQSTAHTCSAIDIITVKCPYTSVYLQISDRSLTTWQAPVLYKIVSHQNFVSKVSTLLSILLFYFRW